MAELADAADSKSAGTWYLGGSTPPPGTTKSLGYADLATVIVGWCGLDVPLQPSDVM